MQEFYYLAAGIWAGGTIGFIAGGLMGIGKSADYNSEAQEKIADLDSENLLLHRELFRARLDLQIADKMQDELMLKVEQIIHPPRDALGRFVKAS